MESARACGVGGVTRARVGAAREGASRAAGVGGRFQRVVRAVSFDGMTLRDQLMILR